MSWDDFLKKLDVVAKFIAVIAAFGGGVFTLEQYLANQDAARVDRALRYRDTFSSGEVMKARQAISDELRRQLPELNRLKATPMPEDVAAAVHAKIAINLVSESRQGKGLGAELDVLIDTFNEVQICIENKLCDKKVAHKFFGEYGYMLWNNFRPYILQYREITFPKYGVGLESFAADGNTLTRR